MSRKSIEQLQPVKHEDVEPRYSKDEILDKLATVIQYGREGDISGDQKLIFELIYSLAKALK